MPPHARKGLRSELERLVAPSKSCTWLLLPERYEQSIKYADVGSVNGDGLCNEFSLGGRINVA